MVVEDEAVIRMMLAEFLSGDGNIVDQAGTIGEALEKMRTNHADAVFLDLFLPDCDNHLDLYAGYRQIVTEFPDVPIIIVTAHSPLLHPPEGVRVIAKPPRLADIQIAVAQATAEAALKREGERLRKKIEDPERSEQ